MQQSAMGTKGFIALIAFRLALQPVLTLLVLLPVLLPSLVRGRWFSCYIDSRKFSQGDGYILNRLLVIASAIQCVL